MWGKHIMEAGQVPPRARRHGGQALHEFQRRHDDVCGAVAIGAFNRSTIWPLPLRLSRSLAIAGRVI